MGRGEKLVEDTTAPIRYHELAEAESPWGGSACRVSSNNMRVCYTLRNDRY